MVAAGGRVSFIRPLLICAIVMEAAFAAIYLARSPAEQIRFVLLAYLIGGGAFAWLLWRLRGVFNRPASRGELLLIIIAGVAFRLTLFPLAPATSTDVYRYLWEGIVQTRGFSPYVLPPTAPELAPLAAEFPDTWSNINHPDIPAIYPPTAQVLFRANAALFGGSLWGWKLILLLFDGVLAVAVAALTISFRGRAPGFSPRGSPARAAGFSPRDADTREPSRFTVPLGIVGLLWCPLLLIETYEGGHLDIVGVTLLAVAFLALTLRRPLASGILLGLSFNIKYLWPLCALIVLTRIAARRRDSLILVVTTLCVAVLAWIPYRESITCAAETARMFAENWTFNDVIFEQLRRLPGPRWLAMAIVLATLGALAAALRFRNGVRSPNTSDSLLDTWRDVWLISGAALLLGPVAYPWYFIWIVPALALRPPLWLVLWVLSVPALHVVDLHFVSTGQWDPMPHLWIAVGLLPAILLAIDLCRHRAQRGR